MIRATTVAEADAASRRSEVLQLRRGVVSLRSDSVAVDPTSPHCRQLLKRIFSVPHVDRVTLDTAQQSLDIEFDPQQNPRELLGQLAVAMRSELPSDSHDVKHLLLLDHERQVVRITRYDDTLSTWEVLHRLPGRMRMRHPSLARSLDTMNYVARELRGNAGIKRIEVGGRTGTLLIEYDEKLLDGGKLLRQAEGILRERIERPQRGYVHAEPGMTAVSGSLALAATADFVAPVLMPASAVLLVATNAGNILNACREVVTLRPGMATLYTTIVGCTLATGFFFPATLMAWFMRYWDRRYHQRLSTAQQDLLSRYEHGARRVWILDDNGVEIEVAIENLRVDDRVPLREGERVPAAAEVVEGEGVVEHMEHGEPRFLAVKPGDYVPAGAVVWEGRLTLRVATIDEIERRSAVAAIVEQSTTPPVLPLKSRGEPVARHFVPPTLAAAGVGFAVVGDLGTALAILRPDYATGAGMTQPLGTLRDISSALDQGIVLRDPTVLQTLPKTRLILIDHQASWENKLSWQQADSDSLAKQIQALRRRTGARIGLISDAGKDESLELGQQWGFDFAWGNLSSADKADVVQQARQQGKRVLFVGDCQAEELAAREADIALSVGDIAHHEVDPAHAFVLEPTIERIGSLWRLSTRRRWRVRSQYALTIVPNLCCVAGAFALGFTGLHAVLLTNLGAMAAYQAGTLWLNRLPSDQRGAA